MSYTPTYDSTTGDFAGVVGPGGAAIPQAPGNRDWQAFLAWNAANGNPINTSGTVPVVMTRTAQAIIDGSDGHAGLSSLTQAQRNAVWSDFTSNSRWKTDAGSNAGTLGLMGRMAQDGVISATTLNLQAWAVALYVQDNPAYLVNPAFDATINVPGTVTVTQ